MRNFRISCLWLILSLALHSPASAALPAATAWEVRPTVGSDTLNGGCFITGSTGTDYSQQDAVQYGAADLAVDAVTDTVVTSATHNFVAADVGNCIQVTAGVGWTTGFYRIVSVAANAATLDRSPAAVGVTGGTYAVGGALAMIAKALTGNVASNKIFVKATGTLTITVSMTLTTPINPSSAVPFNVLQGYTTTRTDGGRAKIVMSTNANLTGFIGTTGWLIQNFDIDCATLGNSQGITLGTFSTVRNVKVANCTSRNILMGGTAGTVEDSEITGCTSACDGALYMNGGNSLAFRNWVHDNAITGIRSTQAFASIVWNLVTNNTGATSQGIWINVGNPPGCTVMNNTVYASGQDGISSGDGPLPQSCNIRNNILVNNGRYGFQGSTAAGLAAWPMYDGNAYFGNVTAARNNMDDTGATNAINGASPYVNVLDVTLTGDPFTNAAANVFTLNNIAGAGAAVRGAGTPGPIPAAGTGYQGMGAFQAQCVATGGTGACAIR